MHQVNTPAGTGPRDAPRTDDSQDWMIYAAQRVGRVPIALLSIVERGPWPFSAGIDTTDPDCQTAVIHIPTTLISRFASLGAAKIIRVT